MRAGAGCASRVSPLWACPQLCSLVCTISCVGHRLMRVGAWRSRMMAHCARGLSCACQQRGLHVVRPCGWFRVQRLEPRPIGPAQFTQGTSPCRSGSSTAGRRCVCAYAGSPVFVAFTITVESCLNREYPMTTLCHQMAGYCMCFWHTDGSPRVGFSCVCVISVPLLPRSVTPAGLPS
jgi:hypothetical protein